MSKRNKKAKSKHLLPKRIAGVKLPKAIRGGGLAALAASPQGAKLMAEMLAAAGGLVLARKGANTLAPSGDAAGDAQQKLKDTGRAVSASSQTLTFALGEAARSFMQALKEGGDAAPTEPQDPARPKRSTYPQQGPAAH